jgi:hypothetical protein
MVSFNVSLFLLALPAFLVHAETKLRGNQPPESVVQRDLQTNGYDERLGQCTGAVCGLWGDPHMITCDGLGFDCQGLGTFNIMDNHMIKIQGRFVDVGAHEHNLIQGWGLTEGASLTNDLAIEDKVGGHVFQFGFGDLSRHDGTFPSEDGCNPYQYYYNINMPGQGRSVEATVGDCRQRCEDTEGCTKFHYWPDGGCHLNNEYQTPRNAPHNWPRVLSGPKEECGAPPTPQELEDDEEKYKSLRVKNDCPLLMHIDGEMIDISQVPAWGFFYGEQGSEVSIQNINNQAILLSLTSESGEKSEIHIWHRGNGPGELWSCHFDFWVCLPAAEQDQFMEPGASSGLLGTPDGNTQNDFVDAEGNVISLTFNQNWHKTLIDYCYDNHCVDQYDSIMTPPKGQTFDDIKCEHVEYVPFDPESPNCVLSAEQIHEACDHQPPLTVEACMLDCCEGGCGQINEVIDEIVEVKTLSEKEEDIIYDIVLKAEKSCVDDELTNTKDTVCPSSETEVVKLLTSSGDAPLPDGDIFYEIKMDSGDDTKGRTLKFKVNNPLDSEADVYVKYGKSVFEHAFMDPKCDPFLSTPSGCNADAVELEVACHDYEGIAPFALVQVYFSSPSIEGSTDIDQCCLTGDEDLRDKGSVMYSFEIQCACPDNNTAVE